MRKERRGGDEGSRRRKGKEEEDGRRVQCGGHSCECVFGERLCSLRVGWGEERREGGGGGGGEAQAVFHETFKPILMRNPPLHVSLLQFKKKKKTPQKRCSRPTEREV